IFAGAAAALGATTAYVHYKSAAAERAHRVRGKFIDVDGVRLHYLERGAGQPLVHGVGSMIDDFLLAGLVTRAAERYRVIAIDRPGYGAAPGRTTGAGRPPRKPSSCTGRSHGCTSTRRCSSATLSARPWRWLTRSSTRSRGSCSPPATTTRACGSMRRCSSPR